MLPLPGLRPPIESDGLKKPSRFTSSGIPENKLLAYFHIASNTSPPSLLHPTSRSISIRAKRISRRRASGCGAFVVNG